MHRLLEEFFEDVALAFEVQIKSAARDMRVRNDVRDIGAR